MPYAPDESAERAESLGEPRDCSHGDTRLDSPPCNYRVLRNSTRSDFCCAVSVSPNLFT